MRAREVGHGAFRLLSGCSLHFHSLTRPLTLYHVTSHYLLRPGRARKQPLQGPPSQRHPRLPPARFSTSRITASPTPTPQCLKTIKSACGLPKDAYPTNHILQSDRRWPFCDPVRCLSYLEEGQSKGPDLRRPRCMLTSALTWNIGWQALHSRNQWIPTHS